MKTNGMPYFLLATSSDDKFKLIEARFGIKGYGVVVKLLCRIYCFEGYYCHWDAEIGELFANEIGVSCSLVSEVLELLLKKNFFDKEKFEKENILTSRSIQEHYLQTGKRRKEVVMLSSFICVNFSKNVYKNIVIVNKNDEIVYSFETIKRKGIESNVIESNVIEFNEMKSVIESEFEKELSGQEVTQLEEMFSFFEYKLIKYSLRECIAANKKSIGYMQGILKNWKQQGITADKYEEGDY